MDKQNADITDLVDHIFADLQKSKKLYLQPLHAAAKFVRSQDDRCFGLPEGMELA